MTNENENLCNAIPEDVWFTIMKNCDVQDVSNLRQVNKATVNAFKDNRKLLKDVVRENEYIRKYIRKLKEGDGCFSLQDIPIEHQTKEICKVAVELCGYDLKDVENQTEEICRLAVQENGNALKYVKEQTESICRIAVQKNGDVLKWVKEQTPELCKLAVQEHCFSLRWVNDQTEELCKIAVQQNCCALQWVNDQTEEICKLTVKQSGLALRWVREQTEEICRLAVQQNGYALQFVKQQTEELCKIAVQQDGNVLRWVKEQTEEICKLAVQQDGKALEFVKEQTESICRIAVQNYGESLRFVKEETEEICLLAVYKGGIPLELVPDRMCSICKKYLPINKFKIKLSGKPFKNCDKCLKYFREKNRIYKDEDYKRRENENKELLRKQKNKEHYEKYKEGVLVRNSQVWHCDVCDKDLLYTSKFAHQRTKKHLLKAQDSPIELKMFNCECGSVIFDKPHCLENHLKSAKHCNYIGKPPVEKVLCGCGFLVSPDTMRAHMKTKKHIENNT